MLSLQEAAEVLSYLFGGERCHRKKRCHLPNDLKQREVSFSYKQYIRNRSRGGRDRKIGMETNWPTWRKGQERKSKANLYILLLCLRVQELLRKLIFS